MTRRQTLRSPPVQPGSSERRPCGARCNPVAWARISCQYRLPLPRGHVLRNEECLAYSADLEVHAHMFGVRPQGRVPDNNSLPPGTGVGRKMTKM